MDIETSDELCNMSRGSLPANFVRLGQTDFKWFADCLLKRNTKVDNDGQ